MKPTPRLSIIIPVLNEGRTLRALCDRVIRVMDATPGGAEAIVVDDGSRDDSMTILREVAARDPRIRVLSFSRNFGQRAAVFAGLEVARGRTVATIDGDLQNPPEDIPILLAKAEEGFDVVGGWRQRRHDTAFRRLGSWFFNTVMHAAVPEYRFRDLGCMMRAYSRRVVDAMLQCEERSPYLPALSCRFTNRIAEVPVGHAERSAGTSQYSTLRLIRLQFDLLIGATISPLKMMSVAATVLAAVSVCVAAWLAIHEAWLTGVLFALVGANLLGLALVGEYLGRVHVEVRRRPRSVIAERININLEPPAA